MTDVFLRLLFVSMMVASVTFTITQTSIFAPLREAVVALRVHKLEELIHCPYCLGHWVTFLTLPFLGRDYYLPVTVWPDTLAWQIPRVLLTAFAVMGIVGLVHFVLLRAYEPVAKQQARRELARVNREAKG